MSIVCNKALTHQDAIAAQELTLRHFKKRLNVGISYFNQAKQIYIHYF